MENNTEYELLKIKYNILRKKYDLLNIINFTIQRSAFNILEMNNRIKDENGNYILDNEKAFKFISGMADEHSGGKISPLLDKYRNELQILDSIG